MKKVLIPNELLKIYFGFYEKQRRNIVILNVLCFGTPTPLVPLKLNFTLVTICMTDK